MRWTSVGCLPKCTSLPVSGRCVLVKTARFLNERIPGVVVPSHLIERLERSPSAEETGLEIALELTDQVKALPGVSGIHLMSVGWESILPRLLEEAGLIPVSQREDKLITGDYH